jgi:peptidoglycan L-alanyl-D-glutamate endopeptidase CwlK
MYTDEITVKRILEGAHPLVRESMLQVYFACRWELRGKAVLRFSHVLRSFKEQQKLYEQGRVTPGKIVTTAKAGDSWHNYGFAFDIVLLVDKDSNGSYESASWNSTVDFDGDGKADWMEVVEIAKALGWTWGGDWTRFVDRPHFQKVPDGLTIQEAKKLYTQGHFIPGTQFIRL